MAETGAGRVVHQHVQPAEARADGVHQLLELRFRADVGLECRRLPAGVANLRARALRALGIGLIVDGDLRPGRGQPDRQPLTDPLA